MAVSISDLSHLATPLATPIHLEASASQLDGLPRDLETSVRFESTRLLHAAGILLRLPNDLIAQSIVILLRFWTGADGGSMVEHDSTDVVAAALYLTAKPSPHPVTPSQTTLVVRYLQSVSPDYYAAAAKDDGVPQSERWHLSEAEMEIARNKLYKIEGAILRTLGFQTHVALPYSLCINYLQALEVSNSIKGSAVTKRAFAHLNTALLSPQLLYLTHQPSSIATAAIYLAAREEGVSLPETEWWEVFDVDREDLGFIVVAMRSVEGFALEEKRKWGQRKVPMTVEEIQVELQR